MHVAVIMAARSEGGVAIAEFDRTRFPTNETPSASVLQEVVRVNILPTEVLSARSSRRRPIHKTADQLKVHELQTERFIE